MYWLINAGFRPDLGLGTLMSGSRPLKTPCWDDSFRGVADDNDSGVLRSDSSSTRLVVSTFKEHDSVIVA
jgi:hypothetical protein